MNEPPIASTIVIGMIGLQEEKERAYGIDWKRFGLVSSFFNSFRKLIRLRTMWRAGWLPTTDDTRFDTVVDLLNYLVLSILLHAELFPEAFKQACLAGTTMVPEDFPTDERGFKRFARGLLLPSASHLQTPPLQESVPAILALGESTIERWLSALAASSSAGLGNASTTASGELVGEQDIVERIYRIRRMVDLCLAAAVRHAFECPDEYAHFVEKYAPKEANGE